MDMSPWNFSDDRLVWEELLNGAQIMTPLYEPPAQPFSRTKKLLFVLPTFVAMCLVHPIFALPAVAIVVMNIIRVYREMELKPKFSLRAMLIVMLWIGLSGTLLAQTQYHRLMALGGVLLFALFLCACIIFVSFAMGRLFSEDEPAPVEPARLEMIRRKLSRQAKS